ncbi:MAG: aspartate:alanine exchanger family transporter [Fimbriimonadaceae bacterium]
MQAAATIKQAVVAVLAGNPVLLLFVVCGLGFGFGRVRFGRSGISLGAASVLFVGLAIGAVDPRLQLPQVVNMLGLVLFMYSVGLGASSGFFAALNRRGLRDTAIAILPLVIGAVATFVAALLINQHGVPGAAIFTGSMSSSSGLAAILDAAKQSGSPAAAMSQATVNYSITYVASIVGPMLVIVVFLKLFRVDLRMEAQSLPEYRQAIAELETTSIRVTKPEATRLTVDDLNRADGQIAVVFGRVVRRDNPLIPAGTLKFELDDVVVVVGPEEQLERVTRALGERLPVEVEHERTELELRRVFVSKSDIAGIPLLKLDLPRSLGVKITRVRRGDQEFIPNGETRLELGDRLRVFSQRNDLPKIRDFFGDSFTALSEVDFLALGLGITAGLLFGLIPFPLPGGLTLRFGFAGGPLLAGIVLAKLNRTGPIIWTLPFSANLTFRQFGLLLFAAAIGTQAGYAFVDTVLHHGGLAVLFVGLGVSITVGAASMLYGHKVLKVPMNHLIGVYVGGQTQPIVLGFAKDRAGNDLAATGYAAVFPAATVAKIVLSEILLGFLR